MLNNYLYDFLSHVLLQNYNIAYAKFSHIYRNIKLIIKNTILSIYIQ